MANAFEQAEFLRSEKDTRPYWETDHRAIALPLIKSGYNDSVRYGVPGLLGGASWGVLDDILRGRSVAKGEVEAAAGDAAAAAIQSRGARHHADSAARTLRPIRLLRPS